MPLTSGAKLGPYEIQSPLGAGGMGEVYRARDTRLDRIVAIKVLPSHLSSDPERRERFEREAKAISALNHPHICTLHDIGREGETDFLVMELVEGQTLAARLEKGPLPSEQVLRLGIEISDALDKAHHLGIIHRDLKPGNIMLIPRSGAKLLDFGLAKPVVTPDSAATAMLTASKPLTKEGMIVGTFQYMAPEQLEGKDADARSDIFAFGAVLYEAATGKKAFEGKTTASVIAAVLASEPAPISALQPLTPPAFERLVKTCLAKDPDERFQSAHDLNLQLKWIAEAGSQAGVPAPVIVRRKVRQQLAWGLAAAFLMLAVVFAFAYFRAASVITRPVRSYILPPEKTAFQFDATTGGPVLSPDGTRLVFAARDASGKVLLWVRPLDSLSAQRLEGTEGASFPFWSPNSRFLGFFVPGKLKKIDVSGGPPQTVCDAPTGRGGTWNADDVIVFAPSLNVGLQRVAAAGGAPVPLAQLDQSKMQSTNRWPVFLPDGRHFLYWAGGAFSTAQTNGAYVGSLDGTPPRFLCQADSGALYARPGYLLYQREQSLMAQPFDADGLKFTGDAFPIAEQVANPLNYRLGFFSNSQNDVLVYLTGLATHTQLTWMDANDKKLTALGEPGPHLRFRLSPDGSRLAKELLDEAHKSIDLWLVDLARGVRTRFTFDPASDAFPVWSPDGARIVFASTRKGHYDLYVKNASGAGGEEPLLESDASKAPTDWSHDGRFIAFNYLDPNGKTKSDIWVQPMFGDRKPFPFLQTEFNEGAAVFSPDGHWIAYQSDESGSFEVYVAPFQAAGGPEGSQSVSSGPQGGKWQVSQGGGSIPTWSRDGKGLYFLGSEGKLMEATVTPKGAAVEVGIQRQVLQVHFAVFGSYARTYDVTPDGKRFLVLTSEDAGSTPLTLVTNWTAGLKK
jgi:Tol biopolymer transport system component